MNKPVFKYNQNLFTHALLFETVFSRTERYYLRLRCLSAFFSFRPSICPFVSPTVVGLNLMNYIIIYYQLSAITDIQDSVTKGHKRNLITKATLSVRMYIVRLSEDPSVHPSVNKLYLIKFLLPLQHVIRPAQFQSCWRLPPSPL